MLTKTDLLHLDHTPDLTEAGILSTCHWLASSSQYSGKKSFADLCRKIAGVSVELAIRRLLAERQVPVKNLETEPFLDPPRHQLSLGGHRLHLNSCLLANKARIRSIRKDPAELLHASASIPLEQFVSEAVTGKDLHLFAFLLGLTARSKADRQKLEATHEPHFYLAVLPKNWSQPGAWISLNPIVLKSEADQPVTVELGGLNASREFTRSWLLLQPGTRTRVTDDFYSLAYIHLQDHPRARLGLHSPRIRQPSKTHIIQPEEWGNVWVYGLELWLAGWLNQEEFRRKALILPAGQGSFHYSNTRPKNVSVPLTELKPLAELLEQARSGQANKTNA